MNILNNNLLDNPMDLVVESEDALDTGSWNLITIDELLEQEDGAHDNSY